MPALLPFSDELVVARLKNLGTFAIDTEIRGLQGEQELLSFLQFASTRLQTHRDFDLINGYVGLFLQVSCHGYLAITGWTAGQRHAMLLRSKCLYA